MRALLFVLGLTLPGTALAAPPQLSPCSAATPRLAVLPPPPGLKELSPALTPVCRAIAGHEGRSVCLTARPGADGRPDHRLGYWVDGKLRSEWPVRSEGESKAPDFTLELAELDGSGGPELIVAVAGEIHVLTRSGQRVGPTVAIDWGDDSQALRVDQSGRCVLRLAQRDAAGTEQLQWFRLDGRRLQPIPPPR